jgi:hypothetical protein
MAYWSALAIAQQFAGELGLPQPTSLGSSTDVGAIQILAFMNKSGNELLTYYPWEQFIKQWEFTTVPDQQNYDVPEDWRYFTNQTQWDRTNHWPLLGPKSPQEWAWLKGGLLASAPRFRYRVYQNKFWVHPVPGGPYNFAIEYIQRNWVMKETSGDPADMVVTGGDTVNYDPWMVISYMKLKFYELKGFDTTGMASDFMRIFNALSGKDKGAPKLSLTPRYPPNFIGPWSIPDGSWDVS